MAGLADLGTIEAISLGSLLLKPCIFGIDDSCEALDGQVLLVALLL